ncbi:hypothetical protein POSPLADRAFT_1062456 [Postia placenta MAD-698-R-SB12]|uniref:Uncharacterized protein n=1 Tax=Postia placenta MAD-698-R-SB12 TaxID=670580 RepID=A0A1X6MJS5_9APHY|nr:hypothetical protein POSPLADRAFT_1062456 [Postia placenta MAD-698-R-SB12]OSX56634.1 hypothetical protein POSPLADRAFT_1062456 [Postia placenta MAD-698-R-SB12]
MSVQIGAQGATTPFRNKAAFAAAFKARFGNLDDEVAAQVELAKLCADKSVRKKHTAAEFSTLFKGPADHSGYGDLELCDKYLSGIPSRMYRKIELETFTTWQAAEKHATEDKPYTKCADARTTVASGSTQAATSAPIATTPLASISAASAKSEQSELADLMAQVKSMRKELEHYRAIKEEGF